MCLKQLWFYPEAQFPQQCSVRLSATFVLILFRLLAASEGNVLMLVCLDATSSLGASGQSGLRHLWILSSTELYLISSV